MFIYSKFLKGKFMNKIIFILITPAIIHPIDFNQEYYEHRNWGLQTYPDVMTQSKFEKLIKKTNDINLKNIFSLLAFTHSIQSLSHKKLYKFTELLEEEYVTKKTAHRFTDITLARVFLERKYPHLHIGTNRAGLSNVFTDMQRIEDFVFNLNLLQDRPDGYAKLIEELYKIQEKINSRHAQLNFAIAVSLANPSIRKKVKIK
jgi:hypothetical protein